MPGILMQSVDKNASPPGRRGASRRFWIYRAGPDLYPPNDPSLRDGYYWSTTKSLLVMGTTIILGLLLGGLLVLVVEL